MGFYLSPGVYVKEKDLSTVVPAVSTTVAALVGYSAKGSLDINLITNKQQFVNEYGEPTPGNYFHYTALAFLENGNRLYCRRVVNGALYPGVHVKNSGASSDNEAFTSGQLTPVFYEDSYVEDELFSILAKDPGVWGNSVSVIIKNVKDGTEDEETEKYTFEIDVYYTDSEGTVSKVENWKVSRKSKIDGYGRQLHLEEKINGYSDYIVVADNTAEDDTTVPKANSTAVSLAGGTDGSTVTASDITGTQAAESGWYGFYNPDNTDVRILLGGCFLSTHTTDDIVTIQTALRVIAEYRKDCIAILDVPYGETDDVDDSLTFRNTTQNFNSSYTALYAPWPRINDPYNDRLLFVPPSGYVGSQMAYNDYVGETWDAPAGFNRGVLNVISLNKIYTLGERDSLYEVNVNPLQVFRGEGIAIWGQKTQQKKASALDRVNVRRLLIVIEKAVAISLRSFAFEPNDELTRFRVAGMVAEYMSQLSARGAFQTENDDGYVVICDDTNNTPFVINANELHIDVFIRPIRSAEFIQLQVIVTDTGASFDELISRGAML